MTDHSGRTGNEDSHRNLLGSSLDGDLSRIVTIRDSARQLEAEHAAPQRQEWRRCPTCPIPPYWAVIFTSRRNEQPGDGYAETADRMFELVGEQPGFLGFDTARSDGLGITVCYWESEAAIAAWKAQRRAPRRATRRPRPLVRRRTTFAIARVERAYGSIGSTADHEVGRRRSASGSTTRTCLRLFRIGDAEDHRGSRSARVSSTCGRGCRGPTTSRPTNGSNANACAACSTRRRPARNGSTACSPPTSRACSARSG